MNFHKFLSTVLHPIVVPTIGVLLYFILIPNMMSQSQKMVFLGLIFFVTYLVPFLLLFLLKVIGLIKSYKVSTIKERKIPMAIMILIYYLLGLFFYKFPMTQDFGTLFYATSIGLIAVYILFLFKLKTSLHLLSLGIVNGFFLLLNMEYGVSFLFVTLILMLFSGQLASARLFLNAHTAKEVYLGFLLGFFCPFFVSFVF